MQFKRYLTAAGLAAMLIGGGTAAANAEPYHGGYVYHDRDRGDRYDWRFRDDHRRFDRDRFDGDRRVHHIGFIRF